MDAFFGKLHSGHVWWGTLQHNCSFKGRDVWLKPWWLVMCGEKRSKIQFYRNRIKIRLNIFHRNSAVWVSCCWTKERSLLDILCIAHHLVWAAWKLMFLRRGIWSRPLHLLGQVGPSTAGAQGNEHQKRKPENTKQRASVPSFTDSVFL